MNRAILILLMCFFYEAHCDCSGLRFDASLIGFNYYPAPKVSIPLGSGNLSGTDCSRQYVLIIHGWNGCENCAPMQNLINTYLQKTVKPNVVFVNWPCYSAQSYDIASCYVRYVGVVVADFVKKVDAYCLGNSEVHLVGFSLGAHIAGVAGYSTQALYNYVIKRITGLEPAGPGFDAAVDAKLRLDKTDAGFVDVLHTTSLFGTSYENGHFDTFVNCLMVSCFSDNSFMCGHASSTYLFAKTVPANDTRYYMGTYCTGLACLCLSQNQAIVGEYANSSTRGSYSLTLASWDIPPVSSVCNCSVYTCPKLV